MTQKIDYSEVYLQTLLNCWSLQANLDLLQGTTVYRQDLKQVANRLAGMLGKIINTDVNAICGVNDQSLFANMDYQMDLIRQLASLKAEDNGIMAIIIEEYKKNPDAVCEALQIMIVDKIPEDGKGEENLCIDA